MGATAVSIDWADKVGMSSWSCDLDNREQKLINIPSAKSTLFLVWDFKFIMQFKVNIDK